MRRRFAVRDSRRPLPSLPRYANVDLGGAINPEAAVPYLPGAPTSFPSGETAYQVPPTPWPLVSPAFESPEKV